MDNNDSVVVHAEGLTKAYDGFTAVSGIGFDIRRGECFGFLGPNGAGKTTTVKMIYGMYPPTAGRLNVLGLDMNRDSRQAKRSIGVMPEETNLDVDLNVIENLETYGNYFDIPRRQTRERALELLRFVELDGHAVSVIDSLSNGMKRRVLLARALINEPRLLVLDEPTTGLDPQMRHLLWDRLRVLKKQGVTQILTTHYMDEAAELCDRLVIMDEGRIIERGAPDELVRRYKQPHLEGVFLKLTGRGLGE